LIIGYKSSIKSLIYKFLKLKKMVIGSVNYKIKNNAIRELMSHAG